MKRKLLSVVLAVSMLAAVLAGCGAKESAPTKTAENNTAADAGEQAKTSEAEETTEGSDEQITLKWAMWDKDTTPYWVPIKEAYEASHPNITIELVDLGSADYTTVLATELSGSGTDFDIVTIKEVNGYATLVSKNALEPLNSYIDAAGIDLSQYGGITDQVTVDGNLYELPFRNDTWIIYYNKDVFDAAGVAYPTNDMTFEEYDALARQVADPTYGSQVYGSYFHTWRSPVQLFGILDGKYTIMDGNYDFMKPFYEMVLSEEDDQICRKYADLSAEGLHYSAAFSGGDIAMLNMGSWFISTMITKLQSGEYDASLCGNWGIATYPHAEGVAPGATIGTVTGISVTSASDHKQEAFDFVAWISGEEGSKVMAATGNFPALLTDDVIDIITSLDGFPTDEQSKEALKTTNVYMEVPYAENVSAVTDILDTYHKSIMNREMSIDDGIAAMNEEVSKVLGN